MDDPRNDDRRNGASTGQRRVPGLIGVVIGLLAVAALVGSSGPAGTGGDARIGVPATGLALTADLLTGVLAGAALIGIPLIAWVLWGAPRRTAFVAPPWWRTPLTIAILAVAVGGLLALMNLRDIQGTLAPWVESLGPQAPGEGEAPGAIDMAGIDERLRRLTTLIGFAVIVTSAAAGLLVVVLRRRLGHGDAHDDDRAADAIAAAVDRSLDALDRDDDPRRAILACYEHLLAGLAAAGCPRADHETPREHQARAGATLGPAAGAAARLVGSFEDVRYGAGLPGPAARDRAIDDLMAITQLLDADAASSGR